MHAAGNRRAEGAWHAMNANEKKQQLLDRLKPYGQEHVLRFWDQLSDEGRQRLARQIEQLDLAQLDAILRCEQVSEDWAALAQRACGPPAFRLDREDERISRQQARQRGEQELRTGCLGVVIVAGGQGTRLGFDAPKGLFPIGPVSEASLFQILVEKVVALGRRYGVRVPLYVMTSPATHRATVDFFADHDCFGLPGESVRIFSQGTMPAVDARTHRLLLAEKDSLALSPDGHGGLVAALVRSGALEDMQRRGLKHLFYMQVDNPLVEVGEPTFLGYHILSGSELSTQVKAKTDPEEKVGNVVSVDGHVRIIEYSDLPAEAACRCDARGELELWAGNIAVHLFDVDFLNRVADDPESLPFHLARKKVPYLDEQGRRVEPSEPNAIKFERFIFDLLPMAQQAIVVEVDPRRVFAPLKNAPGSGQWSPETVRQQMIELHTEWLREAGATVDPGVAVEISPLFALDAEQLRERIPAKLRVCQPMYFAEVTGRGKPNV